MPNHNFLIDIAIMFFTASIAGLALSKLKQPAILAYILTGIILGPGVLGIIENDEIINQLAEIGVIALLFTLGLEFSIDKFKQVGKAAFLLGISQILITIFFVALILKSLGLSASLSILIGCIVSLSSTVIVIKSLSEIAQSDSLHGRLMLGILIIQDLSLIPIMIILPNLGMDSGVILTSLAFSIIKACIFLVLAIFISLKISPIITNLFASTSREILVLSSIAIALGTAIIANYFGISLELGAFIAGLALSITAHSKQLSAEIAPFRDAFAMVFFVSIGLLMDIGFFITHFQEIFTIVLLIIILKIIICFSIIYFAKYPGQTALWVGFSLFQVGEFSFVLAKVGNHKNIINQDLYSLIIISALFTMILTPFFIRKIPSLIYKLQDIKFWNKYFKGKVEIEDSSSRLSGHVIICGYGPIGRSLAKILTLHCKRFIVIELNNETVKKLKKEKIPVIYGDATNTNILRHAGIIKSTLLVTTLPDDKSNEIVTISSRKFCNNLPIIARSRYQTNINKIYKAGASVVIHEEYETALSVISSTLGKLHYPEEEVQSVIQSIRENSISYF